MQPLTIGVLASLGRAAEAGSGGGAPGTAGGAEDAVSDLRSGAEVLESVARLGHRTRLLLVDGPEGLAAATGVDVVIPTLHGRLGGSGAVHRELERRGLPYAGPGPAEIALAFDKVCCRELLSRHNLPVPTSLVLTRARLAEVPDLGLLGLPCMVKPRRGACGAGVARVETRDALGPALARAAAYDRELVIERAISGIEVQVVALDGEVLGAIEVEHASDSFAAHGPATMVCPPRIGPSRLRGLHAIARRALEVLGLRRGLARVDLLVSPRFNEVVLEVEPLPPLHRDAAVARVARAAGIDHEHLVGALIERGAMQRSGATPWDLRPAP